jgi:hypothetical protein
LRFHRFELMKVIRYTLFIVLAYIAISLFYALIPATLFFLVDLGKFWSVVLLFGLGTIVSLAYQMIPGGVTWLISKLSPSRTVGLYTVFSISVLSALPILINVWYKVDTSEYPISLFFALLLTCLVLGITASMIVGAGADLMDEESGFIMSIGIGGLIFFGIGIFLMVCILANKVCYIDASSHYTWYSGIWHGIFVVPNFVLSLFIDGIYCKAQVYTTGYNIWWWISMILCLGAFLGGGDRRY